VTAPARRNLITDVAGLRVGQAQDARLRSGVTVLTADQPFVAGVHVMGGAPGTRETDLLAPDRLVDRVDAIVLAGGSAFGLDACAGVMDALAARGRGWPAGAARIPIVPGAILFDLLNGGDKGWAVNPYRALGVAALDHAGVDFDLGPAGAGAGASPATGRGGVGSASARVGDFTVGALVAVNAVGTVTDPQGRFWAAPFEVEAEFGARGVPPLAGPLRTKLDARPGQSTTIAIVATDAALTKAGCTRMAVAAHDGIARAIIPAHTPFDGDLVFALSTGTAPAPDPMQQLALGHAAATCLARAIARAVWSAMP
jgi:D-aminopeptidase